MSTQTTGTSINKALIKITALLLALTLCFAMPFSASAVQVTGSIYTTSKYTQNARFDSTTIINGIDISEHNGTINWNSLKATDTKVIIIRVGCRGYASKGTLVHDKLFESNISNALANGFNVGVYFYSQALNEAEATEEANFVLKYLGGYDFTLPVYYDYEFAGVSSGRLDSAWKNKTLNKAQMTKNALAFCSTIEHAGYKAGIYASKSFFEDQLDYSQLEDKYSIWLAHYSTKTGYAGKYQLWQYSAKGKISGIGGYVDSNFVYQEPLAALLKNKIDDQVYTGHEITPDLEVNYNGTRLTKDLDYTITYENNVNIGTAKATAVGINQYANLLNYFEYFNIVPPPVTSLQAVSREPNAITVSWDKSSYADKYQIQVHKSTGWINAGTTENTSFTVTGLSNASNYQIQVCPIKTINGANYIGEYCSPIETATFPATPTSLAASSIKANSLKLTWKKQSNASYYNVFIYNKTTKQYDFYQTVNGGKTNYLTISGLNANTKYTFRVSAHKNSKDGLLLNSAKSSKLSVYTLPGTPTLSSAKSSAKKKIAVKWKKVSGVTGYQIMWSTSSKFSSNCKTSTLTGSSKISKTVKTAKSKKTYYVKIRAYKTRDSKKTYSAWSKTIKVKTK